MPPIVVLALGAFAGGAIVHRVIKEVRRINAELDRVKTGRAIDPSGQTASPKKDHGQRPAKHRERRAVLPL